MNILMYSEIFTSLQMWQLLVQNGKWKQMDGTIKTIKNIVAHIVAQFVTAIGLLFLSNITLFGLTYCKPACLQYVLGTFSPLMLQKRLTGLGLT